MGVVEWLGMIFYGLWGWIAVLVGAGAETCRNINRKKRSEYFCSLRKEAIDEDNVIYNSIHGAYLADPVFHDTLWSEYIDFLSDIPMNTTWLEENGERCGYCYIVYMAQHYGKISGNAWSVHPVGGLYTNNFQCDDYKLYKKLDMVINRYHQNIYIVRYPKLGDSYKGEYNFDWNFNTYRSDCDRVRDLSYTQIAKSLPYKKHTI